MQTNNLGFIGLGVMGEPICRNLVKKSGAAVIAFDLSPEPVARLRAEGADVAGSVAEVVDKSEIVFLCLPSAKHVRGVFEGDAVVGVGQIFRRQPEVERMLRDPIEWLFRKPFKKSGSPSPWICTPSDFPTI